MGEDLMTGQAGAPVRSVEALGAPPASRTWAGSRRGRRHGKRRPPVTTAAAAAMALVMAGCWPAPGQGANRAAHNPYVGSIRAENVDQLTELWSATTDGGAPAGVGPPVVSDSDGQRLVHVSSGRSLYGFDVTTGAEMWVNSPPGTLDTDVYFARSLNLDFMAVSSQLGETYWEAGQYDPGTGAGGPVEGYGRIDALQGSGLELKVAFSTFSLTGEGRRQGLFVFPAGTSGVLSDEPGEARMTLSGDRVFHAGPGLLSAEPGEGSHGNGLRVFPVNGGDNNCGPADVSFVCPEWVAPLDGSDTTTPVLSVDGSLAFVGTDAGTIFSIDSTTGGVVWSADVGSAVTGSPALADEILYVPTESGRLVALAAAGCGDTQCEALWTSPAGPSLSTQPAAARDVVFTGSADGSLHAYPMDGCGAVECEPLWSTSTGSRITGAPALAYGRLFVGTEDGRLIAYAISGPGD